MEGVREKPVLLTRRILNHMVILVVVMFATCYEVNNINQEHPPWQKFGDYGKIRHASDSTHEENNIRMA